MSFNSVAGLETNEAAPTGVILVPASGEFEVTESIKL